MHGTIIERVQRGAQYLDKRISNWANGIDLSYLSLCSNCNCVLGQLFKGKYFLSTCYDLFKANAVFGIAGSAIYYGFYVSTCSMSTDARLAEYKQLELEWIKDIKKRKDRDNNESNIRNCSI
jgi:hypothetical protein